MGLAFKNQIPYIEDINLLELTNSIPTPFYIYSQKIITDRFLNFNKLINKKIYYAVKANSNQAIISLLHSLGAGADVVSQEEMERALKAGVSPSKIIFEGVGKSKSDIEKAINNNIRQINIESIEELLIVSSLTNALNKKINIGLRINPDVKANTIDQISTGSKTDKFGIDFALLSKACEIITESANIKFKGISFHIGSQIFNLEIYEKLFHKIQKAIEFFESKKFEIKHLDLGGGFGVDYENPNNFFNIESFGLLIDKFFSNSSFEISLEPGRYLVANAGFIITKILNSKINGQINFLITDAGMQTLLRPAMYDSYHRILAFNNKGLKTNYTIAGPICESSDVLAKEIDLPKQSINDFLIICDVGAYGSVMASNYNSKALPSEVLINKDKFEIIRKSETVSEIINKDIIPSWF